MLFSIAKLNKFNTLNSSLIQLSSLFVDLLLDRTISAIIVDSVESHDLDRARALRAHTRIYADHLNPTPYRLLLERKIHYYEENLC
jgi:hypothetical protein